MLGMIYTKLVWYYCYCFCDWHLMSFSNLLTKTEKFLRLTVIGHKSNSPLLLHSRASPAIMKYKISNSLKLPCMKQPFTVGYQQLHEIPDSNWLVYGTKKTSLLKGYSCKNGVSYSKYIQVCRRKNVVRKIGQNVQAY